MAVEVEDVHGGLFAIFQAFHEGVERGRAQDLPGDPTRRMRSDGVEHGPGVRARVEKARAFRPADHEKQVEALLGLHPERRPAAGGARQPAADADARILLKEMDAAAGRIAKQLPGDGQDLRVLGAHGEEAGAVLPVLEPLEEAQGRAVEDGAEQGLADLGKPGGDPGGVAVVGIAQRMRAVDLQIPGQVAPVRGSHGIRERKQSGRLAVEGRLDVAFVRKAEAHCSWRWLDSIL